MIEKQKMSEHLTKDRIDRAVYIATTIGVGKEVLRSYSANRHSYSCLTDTGVMIIRDPKDIIITMYIASMAQAVAMTKGNLPKTLKKIIKENEKKGYYQAQSNL